VISSTEWIVSTAINACFDLEWNIHIVGTNTLLNSCYSSDSSNSKAYEEKVGSKSFNASIDQD